MKVDTMMLAIDALGSHHDCLSYQQYLTIDCQTDFKPFETMNNAFQVSILTLAEKLRWFSTTKTLSEALRTAQPEMLSWRVDFNLAVLHEARHKKASDPRDKLFAFISLADGVFGSARPDYTRSVWDIYTSFTVNTIWWMGSFDIWCLIQHPDESSPKGIPNLPSWAVDWTIPGDDNDLKKYWQKYRSTSSQMDTYARWGPPVVNLYGGILTIRGRQFDTIQNISSNILATSCLNPETGQGFVDLMRFAGIQEVSDIPNSPQIWAKFWRVLVGDRFPRSEEDHHQMTPGRFRKRWITPTATHEKLFRRLVELEAEGVEALRKAAYGDLRLLLLVVATHVYGRKMFSTVSGRLGLCPDTAKVGDCVFNIAGSRWPVLLRPRQAQGNFPQPMFSLVSVCHVQGLDSKEVLDSICGAHVIHLC